jgi:hypothetical protein
MGFANSSGEPISIVSLRFSGEPNWGSNLFSCQLVIPTPENVLISSGEVGLLAPSKSEDPFGLKSMKIQGALKNLCVSLGQSLVGDESDV